MNLFECPRIDDAAGYVLRALPDSDAESYRHHVSQCEECSAKVAELGFVSHTLLSGVPQFSAPPEIRNRVMAVVRAEAELLQAAGASADRPPRPAPRRSRWGFGLPPLATGALACVLLALGLGVGVLVSGDSGGDCTSRPARFEAGAGSNPSGKLEICGGKGRVALAGMNAPSKGRVYVMWRVDANAPDAPKAVGQPFLTRDGTASVDVGKLAGHPTYLLTSEPSDVGDFPTRPPIVRVST